MKVKYAALITVSLLIGQAEAKTLADAVKQCGQVQNSLKRLVCYDKVVNDMNQFDDLDALMNVPAPLPAKQGRAQQPSVSAPNLPSAQQQVSQFGLPKAEAPPTGMVDGKLYATVTDYAEDSFGKKTFTLDGNQVWQQQDDKRIMIRVNDRVYIEEGALGAFYMSQDSINRRIRVKRVK